MSISSVVKIKTKKGQPPLNPLLLIHLWYVWSLDANLDIEKLHLIGFNRV